MALRGVYKITGIVDNPVCIYWNIFSYRYLWMYERPNLYLRSVTAFRGSFSGSTEACSRAGQGSVRGQGESGSSRNLQRLCCGRGQVDIVPACSPVVSICHNTLQPQSWKLRNTISWVRSVEKGIMMTCVYTTWQILQTSGDHCYGK